MTFLRNAKPALSGSRRFKAGSIFSGHSPTRDLLGFVLAVLLSSEGCRPELQSAEPRIRALHVPVAGKEGFQSLDPISLGVNFTNRLSPALLAKNANLMNGSGVALGDVDGDGWCDVYFCNLEGKNALFRNLGNWRFKEVTREAGIEISGQLSRGAVLADVDGDDDLDLLVTFNAQGLKLYLNDGRGRFEDSTFAAGLSSRMGSTSVALGDVDGDGLLDVYLCNFGETSILRDGGGRALPYGRRASGPGGPVCQPTALDRGEAGGVGRTGHAL